MDTIAACLGIILIWIGGYLVGYGKQMNRSKIVKCPPGYEDWDDCPDCCH